MADYRLPDGIECALVFYMSSDSTGLTAKIVLGGMKIYPGELSPNPDPIALADLYKPGLSDALRRAAPDWRFMTPAEVLKYKEDDHPDNEDVDYSEED